MTLPLMLWELSVAEQRYRAVLEAGVVTNGNPVKLGVPRGMSGDAEQAQAWWRV